MFFIEDRLLHNNDTVIPNSFFELVLPILAPEPHAAAIYLYGYYLSLNDENPSVISNQALADRLGIHIDEVYSAWRLCENLGLIKKHIIDEEVVGSYSIEFRDLRTVIGKTKKNVSTDEILVAYQNEEYKKMYDKIEQTIKYPLSSTDIKKIHQTISDFNISKDLVIEAVLYCMYKKNNRSISMAMGILRNWHLDGIRTVEDLEQVMQGKEKRYLEYKKILYAMGEYRAPTAPEKNLIDTWLDDYKFDLETILDSVEKTLSIKSPNLKYVDGVLQNRLRSIEKMDEQPSTAGIEIPQKSISTFETRTRILELVQFPRKSMRKDELAALDELSRDFSIADVEVAYRYLQMDNRPVTIENLLRLLKGESPKLERRKRITMEQVRKAEDLYPYRAEKSESKAVSKKQLNAEEAGEMGPIAKRMLEKRILAELEEEKNPQKRAGLEENLKKLRE